METESALYQLIGIRINGVMNGITSSDGQYQEIVSRPPSKDIGRACRLNKQIQVKLLIYFHLMVSLQTNIICPLSRTFPF